MKTSKAGMPSTKKVIKTMSNSKAANTIGVAKRMNVGSSKPALYWAGGDGTSRKTASVNEAAKDKKIAATIKKGKLTRKK